MHLFIPFIILFYSFWLRFVIYISIAEYFRNIPLLEITSNGAECSEIDPVVFAKLS